MVRAACGWAKRCNSSTHFDSQHTPQAQSVHPENDQHWWLPHYGWNPLNGLVHVWKDSCHHLSWFCHLKLWFYRGPGMLPCYGFCLIIGFQLAADFHKLDAFCPVVQEKRITDRTSYLAHFFQYGCHGSTDTEKGVLPALQNKSATW